MLRSLDRDALLVPPAYDNAGSCKLDDKTDALALAKCDRLVEERTILAGAQSAASLDNADLKRFVLSWKTGTAAPLLIVAKARDVAADAVRGDILSAIDIGALRDEIEDALADLIPTRATLVYNFQSRITKPSPKDAIFQPKLGEPFGIDVKAVVDLLRPSSVDFQARGRIGAFDIKLVGGLVDALTLKFGGVRQIGLVAKARAAMPPPGGRSPHRASRSGFRHLLGSPPSRPLNPLSDGL